MGWLEDLGNAVVGAVNAVADTVEAVATGTGQAAEDVVETVANGASDLAEGLADTIRGLPVVGEFLAGVTSWLGGVVSEVIGLVGGIVSGVMTIISGVVGGFIRIIGGILTWNAGLVIEGWADIGTALVGAGMLIGGKLLSTIQVLLIFAQKQKRRLSKEEMHLLLRVFRRSIALYNIRIVEGNTGLFGINHRPFTLGNTIYLVDTDSAHHPDLLVHESTHAWQYQHRGARYAMDAVWAQNYVANAYSWQAEIDRGHTQWVDFNLEAQASFLEDIYVLGQTVDSFGQTISTGDGIFFDGDTDIATAKFVVADVDHTKRANTALAFIRSQINVRPSQFLFG